MSQKWKDKRQVILIRDNNTCNRCGIGNNTEPTTITIPNLGTNVELIELATLYAGMRIVKFELNSMTIYCKTNIPSNIANENASSLVINTFHKTYYPYNGSMLNNLSKNIFDTNFEINSELIKKILNNQLIKQNKNLEIDRQGIYLIDKSKSIEFIKSTILHVHHKCYRKEVKIWDQNNDEYITLCNNCHRIVHETQLIPFYNSYNDVIQFTEPCIRCGGQGYLDCYKHVDNGICYNCMGKGYCL